MMIKGQNMQLRNYKPKGRIWEVSLNDIPFPLNVFDVIVPKNLFGWSLEEAMNMNHLSNSSHYCSLFVINSQTVMTIH